MSDLTNHESIAGRLPASTGQYCEGARQVGGPAQAQLAYRRLWEATERLLRVAQSTARFAEESARPLEDGTAGPRTRFD